jgi:C-terminal processing protease CtpA/Prc
MLISGYPWSTSWGGDTVVAVMSFFANTDALIVDLCKCRGGDPDMVALIASYFLGEERTQLSSIYWREGNVTQESWTLPYVPGKRYGSKPIYVLTSKDTFSGAEALAYDLKTLRRATIIGEITRGGAQPGSPYRLSSHFDVFIPIGRSINPVTGTNWEGTGVIPDISVPQEQAFNVAYSMALKATITSLGESPSGLLADFAVEAQTALKDLDNRFSQPGQMSPE